MIVKNFQFSLSNGDLLCYSIEATEILLEQEIDRYGSLVFIKKMLQQHSFAPRFRISLLHFDGTLKRRFNPSDLASGGSYQENFQSGQRRSLSFSLINKHGQFSPSVNSLWVDSRVFFECGMWLPQFGITIWFPKGVFVIDSVKSSNKGGERRVEVSCSDKFKLLEGSSGRLSSTYVVPSNILLRDVVPDLLLLDDGAGRPLDSQPVMIHSSLSGRVTPIKLTEQSGSTRGALLKNVCESVSGDVFYNSMGNLTIVPLEDIIKDTSKPLIYSYRASEGNFAGDDMNLNYEEIVNRVIVIGGTINGHNCRAEALNKGEVSAFSCDRIGYRTAPVINDPNISSDRLAKERAEFELRTATVQKTGFSISIFFNPLLTAGNTVSVSDEFFGLKETRFTIQSVSFGLDFGGDMSITIANINNLQFV